MKTEFKIGDLVNVVIEGIGQDEAHKSDMVHVKMLFGLPIDDEKNLDANIRFGTRIEIMSEQLSCVWGKYYDNIIGDYRYRKAEFFSKTWKDAKQKAINCAKCEAKKLYDIIENRKQALINAGEWE